MEQKDIVNFFEFLDNYKKEYTIEKIQKSTHIVISHNNDSQSYYEMPPLDDISNLNLYVELPKIDSVMDFNCADFEDSDEKNVEIFFFLKSIIPSVF